jgi:putative ATPase
MPWSKPVYITARHCLATDQRVDIGILAANLHVPFSLNSNGKAAEYVQFDHAISLRRDSDELPGAPTKLMKQLGYGKLYRYAHDEPNAYAAGETYLPEGLENQRWYEPTPRGLEIKIAEKLALLKKWDEEVKKNK